MTTAECLGDAPFGFEVTETAEVTLPLLAGELDLPAAASLHECLTLSEFYDAPAVRVDLAGVTFLGSMGIGVLVSACNRTRAVGGPFSLTGGRDMAQRVLETSGLVDSFGVPAAS
jgi:anti-sigma B factor antagonist